MTADCDIAVIGAGISGLTAAFNLGRRGFSVHVFEASSRAGGVIGTEREAGVLYERGPNSILDTSPRINELLDDLGIRGERIDASAISAKRFIVRNGRLVALPMSPPAFLGSPLFSPRAKLRLLGEPFVRRAPPHEEETVAQFVLRRLGREFLDYAIEPFVAGIYAGDPRQLSLCAAFPRLHALEQRYGSLILGQIRGARERGRRAETSKRVAGSFSFHNGMQTLTDALARAVPELHRDTRAMAIRRDADGSFVVSLQGRDGLARCRARAVVLATPADCAATLLRSAASDAAAALDAIPYAPVVTLASTYRRADVTHPLDGFGFLAPKAERRRILGTLFSSSMFAGRAPEDTVLLTTYLGGQRDPDMVARSDEELGGVVHAEMSALIGARAAMQFCAVTRWARAIPQYTLGHAERIRRAESAERQLPGLFLCASYRGGVAVGDCIQSGYRMAEAVTRYLQSAAPP